MKQFLLALLVLIIAPSLALAEEQINDYRVEIDVRKNGDILVAEMIDVTSEGRQIRRGIFRDLPRYYTKNDARLPFDYNIVRISRDGRKEPYSIQRVGNAVKIRIGDADVFLENGRHQYVIEYLVKNQIRHFDGDDELYWNAIGQYWGFPILRAEARVAFPGNAPALGAYAYTGHYGQQGGAYSYADEDGKHVFRSTRAFAPREGMTISLSVAKGVIDPPSKADKRAEWWRLNGGLVALGAGLLALFGYYGFAFNKAGRDPIKGPVFPQYEPPEGYSPAACHHIYYRRIAGHEALIASLVNLGVEGRLEIDTLDKKKTRLTRLPEQGAAAEASPIERRLLSDLLAEGDSKTIGGKANASFTSAYHRFKEFSSEKFGAPYFKWNVHFLLTGIVLTGLTIILVAKITPSWTVWHFAGVAALIAFNLAMAYFMPAPTPIGQEIRTRIEGFRLYLKTAEQLQLNAVKVGSDAPPPMSVERYERFLPYAIALGVEKPWTRHFESVLPKEAESYNPRWSNMRSGNYHSLHGLNSALVSSMSSGVSSSLPQSSSSSGSGGGGFSGGGGGGGGGGGW